MGKELTSTRLQTLAGFCILARNTSPDLSYSYCYFISCDSLCGTVYTHYIKHNKVILVSCCIFLYILERLKQLLHLQVNALRYCIAWRLFCLVTQWNTNQALYSPALYSFSTLPVSFLSEWHPEVVVKNNLNLFLATDVQVVFRFKTLVLGCLLSF